MKKILLILFFIPLTTNLFSQIEIIQKIWTEYDKTKKIAQQQLDGDISKDYFYFEINQNLPALGQKTEKYKLFYNLVEELDDDDFYEQNIKYVTKSYKVCDTNYTEEYLFDDKENLIYYFYKEKSNNCKEIRIYFNNKNLLRISETTFSGDNCQNLYSQVEYVSKNLPDYYKNKLVEINSDVIFIINIFDKFKTY